MHRVQGVGILLASRDEGIPLLQDIDISRRKVFVGQLKILMRHLSLVKGRSKLIET